MSYNARVRARQNRAGGLYGQDRGWEVGSNQGGAIGIPARLVRKVNEKTTPINYDGNGVKRDDRNLVVQQNTLSGVGRWRSQFNVDADGIIAKRYYLGEGASDVCPGGGTSFANKSDLVNAVNLWCNPAKKAVALATYGEINTWDTSLIDDMGFLFLGKTTFNDDISNWDTSNVTDMEQMFRQANAFNQNIGGWNVSKVETLLNTFEEAINFDQNLSAWDVTNVTNFEGTFNIAFQTTNVNGNWKSINPTGANVWKAALNSAAGGFAGWFYSNGNHWDGATENATAYPKILTPP